MFKFLKSKAGHHLEFKSAEERDNAAKALEAVATSATQIAELQAQLEKLNTEAAAKDTQIADLNKNLTEVTASRDELTTKLTASETALTEANSKLDAIAQKGGKPAPVEDEGKAQLTPGSKGDTLLDAVKSYMDEHKCDKATAMHALAKSHPALFEGLVD